MLFEVQSNLAGVEIQEVSHLVRNVGPHALIATVLEPDLDQSLLSPQRDARSNHVWLLKLFTC